MAACHLGVLMGLTRPPPPLTPPRKCADARHPCAISSCFSPVAMSDACRLGGRDAHVLRALGDPARSARADEVDGKLEAFVSVVLPDA
jgi:hypothetical protein